MSLYSCEVVPNSLWPWTVAQQFSPRNFSDSCPLSPCCYLTISNSAALISYCPKFFQHQGLFWWVISLHQVSKGLLHMLFFSTYNCFLWSFFRVVYQFSAELPLTQTVKMIKNLPAMQETQVWSLCQEDPLEKWISSHTSILAWRIPRIVHGGVTKSLTKQSDFRRCLRNT